MSKMKTMSRSPRPSLPAGRRPRRWPVAELAALLLAVHFVLAVGSKRHESTTSDEIAHLTAGVSFWTLDDYRLHPENGILPERWAALPAWLMGAKFPNLTDNPYWRVSDVWIMGHIFFYETGEDHFPRLMAGRAMIAIFSVATGLLVFCWTRRLWGDAAALGALTFFAFCPTWLAHGALVTSDACMAFFFLAGVGAWWRHLHDPRARAWWLSAGVIGLAFVAKHSVVLLIPMMVIMAVVRAWSGVPLRLMGRSYSTKLGQIGAAAASALAHGGVAWVIIWAFYGFRYTAFNPALPAATGFIRAWEFFIPALGFEGRLIDLGRSWHVLPEAYLYGFTYVISTVNSRLAFLNGEYAVTGWRTFFLWSFLLKTTLALLLATLLTALFAARRMLRSPGAEVRGLLYTLCPLLTLFVVYWWSSINIHLNIGHRHILPVYPVLCIFVGALVAWLVRQRRWGRALLAVLLAGHVAAAAQIAPHFIAYFNELGGGPSEGRRHLVDSSVDWGQDLPGLKAWLDAHPTTEPVYLSYFGTGEPAYYGIKARRLAFLNLFRFPIIYTKLEPGVYCISATILSQVYTTVGQKWTRESEQRYQQLRAAEPDLAAYVRDPGAWLAAHPGRPAKFWADQAEQLDIYRLARLCQYLRVRKPDAEIGYSILIYRLNQQELDAATGSSLSAWAELIERTATETR